MAGILVAVHQPWNHGIMRDLSAAPMALSSAQKGTFDQVSVVLTDIDDTLTDDGLLRPVAYAALGALKDAGFLVVPVTGRPAGWCDHIARMWPVDGVVGENGAFYFRYDHQQKKMIRRYWYDEAERKQRKNKLETVRSRILAEIPGVGISADQPYREADLAVDFCEDVPPLDGAAIQRIVDVFHEEGADCKVSSIHVNGWFGDFDKLRMSTKMLSECFGLDIADPTTRDRVVFVGDSPNDAPMFSYFPHAVGVANVADFLSQIKTPPRWITQLRGGGGFGEVADVLIGTR